MQRPTNMLLLYFMACLLLGCQASYVVKPGSFPKDIHNQSIKLTDINGSKIHLLDLYRNQKAIVLFFFQTKCPCVKRYQERIHLLYNRYAHRGIQFFYVSSNRNESFPEVIASYQKQQLKVPLLRDEEGQFAQFVGAKGTPASVIVNGQGEIEFFGWIDNERQQHERNRIAFLEEAIADIIDNRPVRITTSPMFGCPIR